MKAKGFFNSELGLPGKFGFQIQDLTSSFFSNFFKIFLFRIGNTKYTLGCTTSEKKRTVAILVHGLDEAAREALLKRGNTLAKKGACCGRVASLKKGAAK